jgi:hypothetical protein
MRSLVAPIVLALALAAAAQAEPAADRVTASLPEPSLAAVPRAPVERERLALPRGARAALAEVAPAAPDELRRQFESFMLQQEFEAYLRQSSKPARR